MLPTIYQNRKSWLVMYVYPQTMMKCAVCGASKSGYSSTARGMTPLTSPHGWEHPHAAQAKHWQTCPARLQGKWFSEYSRLFWKNCGSSFTYLIIVFYQHRGAKLDIGSGLSTRTPLPMMLIVIFCFCPNLKFLREILACLVQWLSEKLLSTYLLKHLILFVSFDMA